MGAIGNAIGAFVQPLLDETDGSEEQLNRALTIGTMCWNLALMPEAGRDKTLADMRSSLNMDDAEFEAFQRAVIGPMIRRHEVMFPGMHGNHSSPPPKAAPAPRTETTTLESRRAYPGTGRNAPCPCNSGRKYKHCCGR